MLLAVPLKSCNANLETVHSSAGVLELLVPGFESVVVVLFVIVADAQSGELSVLGHEIRRFY